MGLNIPFSSFRGGSSCDCYSSEPSPPDPRPDVFTITGFYRRKDLWVLYCFYPGTTTCEGEKIVVVRNSNKKWIPTSLKRLDPHFADDGFVVARFRGDSEGQKMARAFVDMMGLPPDER